MSSPETAVPPTEPTVVPDPPAPPADAVRLDGVPVVEAEAVEAEAKPDTGEPAAAEAPAPEAVAAEAPATVAEATVAEATVAEATVAEATVAEATAEEATAEEATAEEATAEEATAEEAEPAIDPAQAKREEAWARIEAIKQEDGFVRGPVTEVVKGGLILDIGLRGFLPASLVEMRRVRDLQPYVGRELEAKIIELDKNRNNVVLSRRAWLEQNRTAIRGDLLSRLQKGQVRKGVVSSVVNFGAFVDLGGVDGLVHVSELSWRHIDHPSDVVQVGQEVEVEVLEVDQARKRVSLSLKATQEDPWRHFARTHALNQIVPGTVTKLVPFGAFVRVDDGIEGLVHISELAEGHIELPEQIVRVGDEVFVKVTDIDLERRRISLSLKQANAVFVEGEEHFDPTLYGMSATYDNDGNYIYPEGFDPDTGEWLEGFEAQRETWEREYAEAHDRWEAHGRQVLASRTPGQ
ncbi:S1 RNA-binding domain-containing protein [Paractinoplanes globisporus]|uniref:S1 RNA-binding domain-containing protein n=1 Tax=Paractinoplanes globisporus TaxID=113565 RepID=A0ABW6WTR9_9ACTN